MGKKSVYRKAYRLRAVGPGGYETMVPLVVVEKEARKRGLTPDEFAKRFQVVHLFNDFVDFAAAYRFEPIEEEIVAPPEIL